MLSVVNPVPWERVASEPGMFRCRTHDEKFKAGKQCSACKPGDFQVESAKTAAELHGDKARERGLFGTLEYEQIAMERSDHLWVRATRTIALDDGTRVPAQTDGDCARLAAESGKHLGRAMESARWREDWELAARRVRGVRSRPESAHPVDGRSAPLKDSPGQVRH